MTDARGPKRYARALFQAAVKDNVVSKVDEDLVSLSQAINASESLRKFLLNPTNAATEKNAYLEKTLSGSFHPLSLGLIKLAISKGRDLDLIAIQLEYSELRRQHEKIVKAVIESALELADDQKQAIADKISAATGRRVEPEYRVDPRLIGGVRVAYDNFVLDGSARGHLERMKEALLRDTLKQA